jgi:hypothetical protein
MRASSDVTEDIRSEYQYGEGESRMGRLNISYCVMAQLKVTLSSIVTATMGITDYGTGLRVRFKIICHRGSCHLLIF